MHSPSWTREWSRDPGVEGLAQLLALQARVKVNSSGDGAATGQQMREPTAFLSTPVGLCLESLVPEPAPHSALAGGTILQGRKPRPVVAQGPVGAEQDEPDLSLSGPQPCSTRKPM